MSSPPAMNGDRSVDKMMAVDSGEDRVKEREREREVVVGYLSMLWIVLLTQNLPLF